MYKNLFIFSIVFLMTGHAHGQSLAISDLTKLVKLPYTQATDYITTGKPFKQTSFKILYKTPIAQYATTLPNGHEFVVKTQWQDTDKSIHHTIHYDFKAPAYAAVLIKQLVNLSFKLKSKKADDFKTVYLYETTQYLVNIYMYADKATPSSMEVTEK